LARRDWPVRSMQPQPASLVQPFSPPHQFRRVGELLCAAAPISASSAESAESRIGWNCERYVHHTRLAKSA
jgi:hypothetical protein